MALHKIVNGVKIDLHPLEEQTMLAQWEVGEVDRRMPKKPNRIQEHEWLIEHGAEYVKMKRDEYQAACDALQPERDVAENKRLGHEQIWQEHCKLCVEHELNPDTFEGDAREKLVRK